MRALALKSCMWGEAVSKTRQEGRKLSAYDPSYPVAKRLYPANLGSEIRLDILEALLQTLTIFQKFLGMLIHLLRVDGFFTTPDGVDSGFAEGSPLLLCVVKTCSELAETADGPEIEP